MRWIASALAVLMLLACQSPVEAAAATSCAVAEQQSEIGTGVLFVDIEINLGANARRHGLDTEEVRAEVFRQCPHAWMNAVERYYIWRIGKRISGDVPDDVLLDYGESYCQHLAEGRTKRELRSSSMLPAEEFDAISRAADEVLCPNLGW